MTKGIVRSGLAAVGCTLALGLGVSAQQPARTTVQPYTVGQAQPPLDPGKTLTPLTLEQALSRALEQNLDIQSARLDPRIQEYSLYGARAAFSPTLNLTYGYNNATTQSTSQLDGGARTTTQRQTFNMSVNKLMPWSGGRLTANFNNARTATDNVFTTRNPSYSSTLDVNYTQPLLAGLKTDNQRAALETQQILSQITDLRVRAQVENIMHQVRRAYWGLRAAIEQIEIQRRSLAQAELLLEENRVKVRLGRLTELQLLQAEAQVASAQQSLLNAEIQWRNQEFAFKRLLMSSPGDPLLSQTINPTDQPQLVDQEVDMPSAITSALRDRMDIKQQRQQIEVTQVNLGVSRSNALPDLNLTARYSLQGVGGNLFERSGLGGEPVLVSDGSYLDALHAIRDFDTPTWSIQLNASYPLGPNPSKADLERARLQLRQAELDLTNQEIAIQTEVTTAGLAVRNTFLQYEAARRNREAAERNAQAELLRFDLGVATNFEAVSAQNALTTARLSELRAIIDHVNAVSEFERVQRVGG